MRIELSRKVSKRVTLIEEELLLSMLLLPEPASLYIVFFWGSIALAELHTLPIGMAVFQLATRHSRSSGMC